MLKKIYSELVAIRKELQAIRNGLERGREIVINTTVPIPEYSFIQADSNRTYPERNGGGMQKPI